MSNVIVHRHAAKYLKLLPKETKDRIKNILKQLENNPLKHSGIKQMFGE
jgi:mRNA-degrading endonuclease RelE of RelBE toxin-antitoxin system